MDQLNPSRRSWNMSRIRSINTSPELIVRKFVWSLGYRYRKNVNTLPGKPDIVIRSRNIAIFINGCFWHQHVDCKRKTMPKSNTAYWKEKLARNVLKQAENISELKKLGWNVLVIWECQTKYLEGLRGYLNKKLSIN